MVPGLLGSNPIDAAKNMEILQRRNQWNYQRTLV
jgi:hypothetical protein